MTTPCHYNPHVHTRERLLRQIELHGQCAEETVLIGSLGRAAALRSDVEFRSRSEVPERKHSGHARDIDLFLPCGGSLPTSSHPFPVDSTAITAHDQRVVFENGDYWLVDDLIDLSIKIDAAVFEPFQGRLLGGLDVTTFSPRTHLALLFVIFEDARKYQLARETLRRHVPKEMSPAERALYRPFSDFHRIRRGSFLNQARRAYRRVVPYEVRSTLQPWVRECRAMVRRQRSRD